MKKTSFLMGTLILAMINFVVRALGFAYRIILSRMIGSHAIGLYQMVFPFLMMVITLTTAGIPIAVSKLVAKENSLQNRQGVYRVLSISLLIGGSIAGLLTVLVSLNMNFIVTHFLKNEQLYYPLLWSIPAIGLITFSSILRGFFYGLKNIKLTGIAQIIEQITRIGFVILLLSYIKPTHPITAATIAIVGLSVGEFLGLLFLILQFNYKKLDQNRIHQLTHCPTIPHTAREIMYISVPITISRLISVFMQTINSILIPQRLELSGMSNMQAIDIFGKLSGMAAPILFLPYTITVALSLNIIPNLAEEMAAHNVKQASQKINLAIKITFMTAIPIMGLFVIFGEMISSIFYGDVQVGQYISIMGYATLFLCMQSTLSGILHGLGKQVITTVNYLLGMVIQLYCTYFLVANPTYGINGYMIGYIASSVVIFILHFITLARHIKLNIGILNSIIKPLFSSCMMLAFISLSTSIFATSSLTKALILFIGFCIYCLCLVLTKAINLKTAFKI